MSMFLLFTNMFLPGGPGGCSLSGGRCTVYLCSHAPWCLELGPLYLHLHTSIPTSTPHTSIPHTFIPTYVHTSYLITYLHTSYLHTSPPHTSIPHTSQPKNSSQARNSCGRLATPLFGAPRRAPHPPNPPSFLLAHSHHLQMQESLHTASHLPGQELLRALCETFIRRHGAAHPPNPPSLPTPTTSKCRNLYIRPPISQARNSCGRLAKPLFGAPRRAAPRAPSKSSFLLLAHSHHLHLQESRHMASLALPLPCPLPFQHRL